MIQRKINNVLLDTGLKKGRIDDTKKDKIGCKEIK